VQANLALPLLFVNNKFRLLCRKYTGKEPSLLQLVLQKGTSIMQVGVGWRLGNIIVDFQHDMAFNTRGTEQTDAPRLTDLPWLRLQSPWYE